MNPLRGVKALTRMVFRRWGAKLWFLPGSRIDWSQVGDGTGSNVVMAPVMWIGRTFPEAPPALYETLENGQETQIRDHELLKLLARPNGFYTGPVLWMATMADWNIDGNAYWLKIRDKGGRVSELWYAPHWTIAPRGDEKTFVTHYDYRPEGVAQFLGGSGDDPLATKVDPSDVVHFRFGIDRDDPRKGYAPLKSVLREVFTDDEAANFTAQILRNMGVPGLLVSPEQGAPSPSADDVTATKEYLRTAFSGDRRGEPLVMSGATRVQQFGFSPNDLLLNELRRVPEERVCAVLGIPPMVVGFGAGLERSTFTNMGEAREMAYESNIIPTQRILAEDIRFQLLPDFERDPHAFRFGFDLRKVKVLQAQHAALATMWQGLFQGGLVTRGTALRGIGLPAKPADEVFQVPIHAALVPEGADIGIAPEAVAAPPVVPPAAPAAAGNGNGNAGKDAALVASMVVSELQRRGQVN